MLSRALSTALLGLLAWFPLGRAPTARFVAERSERALLAVSVLDVATAPAWRVGEVHSQLRELTQARRAPAWRAVPTPPAGGAPGPIAAAAAWRPASRPAPTGWRRLPGPPPIFPPRRPAP